VPLVKAPKAPDPPDPVLTARAQTASNVATAIANTRLSNADEITPLGSVKYKVIGYETQPDGLGGFINVPKYQRVETLSPEQQKLFEQEQEFDRRLNQLAIDQTGKISDLLSNPISLEGLPDAPGDMEEYRQHVLSNMLSRIQPQLDRERSALETQLVNQGLVRGSEAFNRALDEARRQANDAYIQADLASGAEAREQGSYQATNRERALQERLLERTQPINEITALMSGGQVVLPQFTPYRPSPMSETPYGDYVYRGYQGQLDAWKTQAGLAAQNNAGLFGLGGRVVSGLFALSDVRFKEDIEPVGKLPSGLNVYTFRYKGGDQRHIGVLAQEVQKVVPDAVVADQDGVLFVDYERVF
jgi:hypothetical protein